MEPALLIDVAFGLLPSIILIGDADGAHYIGWILGHTGGQMLREAQ